MDSNQLIDALGGTCAVAAMCEVTPQAVSQWRTDGIPHARMMYLRVIRPDVASKELTAAIVEQDR